SSVPTEKIDISGRQADFVARQVPVSVSNPKATVLESVVDAVFRIGESRIERTLSVAVMDFPGKRETVTIYGPRSLVEKVTPSEI
ncbi:hypothetical protein OFC05_30245, partial [Escherichia coli]|nr:hypothetical protein [Escherichia coli]